jgi:MFS family permease
LCVGTIACVGTWSVVVSMPAIQDEFHVARAGASFPYTVTMLGFGFGSLAMGRIADRFGMAVPIVIGAFCLLAGYFLAAQAGSLTTFALAHGFLIGIGASAGFAPLMADLSHWFVRFRGLAVTVAATGSYLAGALWPQLILASIGERGWRQTHVIIGVTAACALLPLSLVFLRRPTAHTMAAAEKATAAARGDLGLSPRALQFMLIIAGFGCCMAMSMPQVHLVAYCGDLGYGAARGAEMLSLMLGLGIVSRLASGIVSDRIGGPMTLLIGSLMQALALFLYLFFDGLTSLYVISGLFGLFQGGIVPMYTVIIRAYLPPREAGTRVGYVMLATVLGMALGGLASGYVFDIFASYRMAFLNGLMWNLVNLAIVSWLIFRPTLRPHAA